MGVKGQSLNIPRSSVHVILTSAFLIFWNDY